jgi:hypothetical protein
LFCEEFFSYYKIRCSVAGVFNLYLHKGHMLMAERFAGRIHVLQSKVCILLQDLPTSISLHKHTQDSLLFYLFINLWFIFYYYYSPWKHSLL